MHYFFVVSMISIFIIEVVIREVQNDRIMAEK